MVAARTLVVTLAAGLLAIAAAHLAPAAAQSPADRRAVERLSETDLPGFDYEVLRQLSLDACEAACVGDAVCRGYTYNQKAQWCFLKSDLGQPAAFKGAVSGRIVMQAASRPAAAPLPLPDLSYLPGDIIVDAARFRAEVAAAARMHRDLPPLAADQAARLAAGGSADWLAAAGDLLERTSNDWSENFAIERAALGAAYLALATATTTAEQAAALDDLGAALERRQIWRPAIESLKASLALSDDAEVREDYERLRDEHGFRIVDYSIDSDAAQPRMCVQFSEPLATGRTDFAKYVSVIGIVSPVVTASGNELCVDGLTHGERYEVTVRAGVPSTVDESLKEPAGYTVYVRDRKPAARFAGSAYVLPRTGARGVPVVSVNSAGLDLELLKVGDRALARSVVDGSFRRQLQPYEVETVADQTGAAAWSGSMAVERVLNQEVTTAFPVDEAIGKLDPGVYVLVAKPEEEPDETGSARATQWFIVSDLGIATFSGTDGIHAFVRSLSRAAPVEGAEVRLVARNDEVLASARTDAAGHAVFPTGLARGTGGMTPTLLVAMTDADDYSFLDLSAPGFDLTDRGVEGRPAPGPLDAFVYTERGVYRAGETVNATALLRDARADAVPGVPVTLKVTRPDGVEYAKATPPDGGLGGRTLPVDLVPSAMSGTWRIEAFSDPKAPAIGAATFLVEDFVPQRIELDLESASTAIGAGAPATVDLEARFLYGAPAADLGVEGDIVVKPAEGGPLPGYRFGLVDDPATPTRRPILDLIRTDSEGRAKVTVKLPDLDPSTRPRVADIILRVREPGGRAVEKTLTLPVTATGPRIGVKPLFADDRVGEGATAAFEVAAVDRTGARTALSGVAWELLKVERRFQWYNEDGRWTYQVINSTSRVASGTLDLGAAAPGRIAAPVEWGTYRLEVTSDAHDEAATSVDFAAGWVALGAGADTPDLLEVALDKPGYAPGETAKLRLTPQFAGTALVAVVGEGLLDMRAVDVPAGGTVVDLPVTDAWTPGAYVTATLYRPMDVDAGRMPARAIGLAWLGVDRAAKTLNVSIGAPAEVEPRGGFDVPVTVTGLAAGEEAYVTLAAVDVGILNLTRYEPPAAAEWYLGQRRLSAEIRDLYGALIDSLAATRGRIRSGGDAGGGLTEGNAPTQELVAEFSGILRVDADGKAEAHFELPAFNGTVKVMAVAWSKSKIGNAATDVLVRDPVVVMGSLPRFLAPGDDSRLRLDLDNVAGAAGDYALAITGEGAVATGGAPPRVTLAAGGKASVDVPLTTAGIGAGAVTVALTAPDGTVFDQSFSLAVRPAAAPIVRRSLEAIAQNGGSTTLGADRLAGLVPASAELSVTVSDVPGVDVPGLVQWLDRYPYGCAEQTTSRALPLLYLADVAASVGLGADDALKERVRKAIDRLMQYQSASGSFGLWGPDGGDLWLTAYVTDFLTRAREKGYAVPDEVLSQALDRIQNDLNYAQNFDKGGGSDVAYGLYVLARNGRASIADLRYFADDRLGDFGSGFAQAQIAAGLAFYGDKARAAAAFETAANSVANPDIDQWQRTDFGTAARDAAGTLALVAEAGIDRRIVPAVAQALEIDATGETQPSTQEAAWMLVAANALTGAAGGLALDVDGLPHAGALFRRATAASLEASPLTIVNRSSTATMASITVEGTPLEPLPAAQSGLTIDKQYYHLDGSPASVRETTQNDRFIVVLTLTATEPRQSRLLVADLLPAGFEIENPALMTSADLAAFPWLSDEDRPAHVEFRDDRFVAAYDTNTDATKGLTLAYMVRAVSPGDFTNPGASVEDMYRPNIFARTAAAPLTVKASR
jgi:uncharacterized protein YfaS (alpha-2-macroglobulin family)